MAALRLLTVLLTACDLACNPRSARDPDYCRSLGENIRTNGQKVPIIGFFRAERFQVADGGCRVVGMRGAGMTDVLALDWGKEVKLGIDSQNRCSVARKEVADSLPQKVNKTATASGSPAVATSTPLPPPALLHLRTSAPTALLPEPVDADRLIGELFKSDSARGVAARDLSSFFSQSPAVKALIALLEALRTEQNMQLRPVLVEAIEAIGGKVFLAKI